MVSSRANCIGAPLPCSWIRAVAISDGSWRRYYNEYDFIPGVNMSWGHSFILMFHRVKACVLFSPRVPQDCGSNVYCGTDFWPILSRQVSGSRRAVRGTEISGREKFPGISQEI